MDFHGGCVCVPFFICLFIFSGGGIKKKKRLRLSSERRREKKKKSEETSERVRQRLIPTTNDMILQGVDYCLQSTASPPSASDSVSHSFSATAISHGLDTRVLLQRNPYNRLTVIKETSLQSNKISNFQLSYQGRLPVSGVVLFISSFQFVYILSLFFFIFHLSSNTFIPQAL